jgi:hypothetical protein
MTNSICEKRVAFSIGEEFDPPRASIQLNAGTGAVGEEIFYPSTSILGLFVQPYSIVLTLN